MLKTGLHAAPKGRWLQPLALAATIAMYTQRPGVHAAITSTFIKQDYMLHQSVQPLVLSATTGTHRNRSYCTCCNQGYLMQAVVHVATLEPIEYCAINVYTVRYF
jgi:hypothetical protein